jgi:hypothetical protein
MSGAILTKIAMASLTIGTIVHKLLQALKLMLGAVLMLKIMVAVAMVEAPIPMVMEYQTPTMLAQMKPPMLKMMLIVMDALTMTDLETVMETETVAPVPIVMVMALLMTTITVQILWLERLLILWAAPMLKMAVETVVTDLETVMEAETAGEPVVLGDSIAFQT